MRKKIVHILWAAVVVVTFNYCSKESSGGSEPIIQPPTETVILEPSSPVLTFPENNEPCLTTTEVNDTQSSVTFQWNSAENAVSYQVVVRNLSDSSEQEFSATTNQKAITLTSAEPYSWKVRAIGQTGSSPAESSTWRFYLPGPSQVNYAPFPAELTSPASGSRVTAVNGLINLQWTCSDADNDLDRFVIYMDTVDGSTQINTIDYSATTTVLEVQVEDDTIYFWKVVAIDAQGNQSNSGVYSFRTN